MKLQISKVKLAILASATLPLLNSCADSAQVLNPDTHDGIAKVIPKWQTVHEIIATEKIEQGQPDQETP